MAEVRHTTDVQKLTDAIARAGMTWLDLAEKADVSKSVLSKVRTGRRPRLGYESALRVRRVLPELTLVDLGHPELQARIESRAAELAGVAV